MGAETKTSLGTDTISTLQDLIQVNIDSRDGLNDAADQVDDVTLSSVFQALALERNDQISELRSLVAANAEEPEKSGSMPAVVHRAWMDLRAALGGGSYAVLTEAERGEDHILGKYDEALKANADGPVANILRRQHAAVKQSHDRIRDLRDEYKS